MSKNKPAASDQAGCDEKGVAAYLRAHPDFFTYHSDLLAEINVPHVTGSAVSLVERQVTILRDQNRQLRRRIMEMVEAARENDRLLERLQRFTLGLMELERLEDLPTRVLRDLREEFDADRAVLRLFLEPAPGGKFPEFTRRETAEPAPGGESPEFTRRETAEPALGNVLRAGKPVCGRPKPSQLLYLFGEQADLICSAALVPLGEHGEIGILAVGSYDEQRFHPEMGKLFLGHIGAAVAAAAERLAERSG